MKRLTQQEEFNEASTGALEALAAIVRSLEGQIKFLQGTLIDLAGHLHSLSINAGDRTEFSDELQNELHEIKKALQENQIL